MIPIGIEKINTALFKILIHNLPLSYFLLSMIINLKLKKTTTKDKKNKNNIKEDQINHVNIEFKILSFVKNGSLFVVQ